MVKIAAVVDSACLIGLERIGRLDLLPALLDPIFAPPAVKQEFGVLPAWMTVERPADVGMVAARRLIGDPGESAAIVLAYEKGLRIILDDRKAREVAQRAEALGVDMPITRAVTAVLDGRLSPRAAVEQLMSREARHE